MEASNLHKRFVKQINAEKQLKKECINRLNQLLSHRELTSVVKLLCDSFFTSNKQTKFIYLDIGQIITYIDTIEKELSQTKKGFVQKNIFD